MPASAKILIRKRSYVRIEGDVVYVMKGYIAQRKKNKRWLAFEGRNKRIEIKERGRRSVSER